MRSELGTSCKHLRLDACHRVLRFHDLNPFQAIDTRHLAAHEQYPNVVAPRKRPFHTIIPAFMQKGDVRIGFGIMGGFNQAQAHAQFVANIADYAMTIQEALEAGRFRKGSFAGCDVDIEALVPSTTIDELRTLGHQIRVVPPRSGTFGWGQAVMTDGSGVHFGASEPRHDGAAIPEAPPVFDRKNR